MSFLVVVFLLFFLVVNPRVKGDTKFYVEQQSIPSAVNDDYCDEVDGRDEIRTSACSHIHKKSLFYCNEQDDSMKYSIPTSRVNDGVCDCCDGSDESNNAFIPTSCPKTLCEEAKSLLKRDALAQYRHIQSSLRARAALLDAYRQKKNKERKSYDELLIEKDDVMKLLLSMRVLLRREVAKESTLRFKLIREREHRCAVNPEDAACNIFFSGFYADDELIREGEFLEYANKRKRLYYEYTEQELNAINKLSGMERVRKSICAIPNVLPDEDSRVFPTVGELITFMSSPGGKQRYDRLPHKMRKETLFGPFLNDGQRGHLTAALVALETIGLILSPITLSMRGISSMYSHWSLKMWNMTSQIAQTNQTTTVILRDNSTDIYSIVPPNITTSNDVIHYIQSFARDSIVQICVFIAEAEVEGSRTFNLLNLLDYERSVFVQSIIYEFYRIFATPLWMWRVIWQSPMVLYDYYVLDKGSLLPPARPACLLRSGIEAAEREMQRITSKIEKEDEIKGLIERAKLDKLSASSNKKWSSNGFDFGPDNAWESFLSKCVHNSFSGYNYTFCFFGDIKQNERTLLGQFKSWGIPSQGHSTIQQTTQTPSVHQQMFESTVDLAGQIADKYNIPEYVKQSQEWLNNQSESIFGENSNKNNKKPVISLQQKEEELELKYTHQFYDKGTYCQGKIGHFRQALVTFQCDPETKIVDVTEVEICSYELIVATPLACLTHMERRAMERLEQLGVFGFAKSIRNSKT